MSWLTRLFAARTLQAPAPTQASEKARANARATAPAKAPAVAAAGPAASSSVAAPAQPLLLPWLLQCSAPGDKAFTRNEQHALEEVDKMLALPALPDDMLPRAAALIPQLLAMLRQSSLPVAALTQRVAKDMVLTAEVLRLASSPFYRAQGAVTDLAQAISLIGENGLQTVIARVVLKPMYDAPAGTLSARAAARLWDHAEVLAQHASATAASAGAPAFDGYLAGLLHGSGWSVLLRVVDRIGPALTLPPSSTFAAAGAERAHQLFGQAAQRWNITPGFSEFGADARAHTLATSQHPLALALRQALPLAMAELAPAAAG